MRVNADSRRDRSCSSRQKEKSTASDNDKSFSQTRLMKDRRAIADNVKDPRGKGGRTR